jgi:hypothetical protein
MAQQYAPQDYWKSETGKALAAAAESGPRAGQAGYAQRADIQAWIDANKNAPAGADGKNAVQRFLEQQRQKGLMDTSDLMAAPMANRSEEIYSGKLLGGDELPGIQATGRTIGANSQSWPEAAMPAERVTAAYGGMDLRPGATEYANAPMSGAAVEAFGAKARSGAPLLQATPATEALARNPQAWPQGGTDSEQITAAFGGRQQEAPQAEPSWLANAIRDDQITSAYGGRQPEAAQPEAAPQAAPATWPANAEDQGRIAAAYGGGMDLQAPGNLTNPQQNRANNLLGNYVSFLKGQF